MNHKQLHREYFCKNCSRFIFVQVLIDLCQILLRVCKFYKQVFTALGFNDNNSFVEYKTCFILFRAGSYPAKLNNHYHHHLEKSISIRSLIAIGIAGGIAPCLSARILLLGAIALH